MWERLNTGKVKREKVWSGKFWFGKGWFDDALHAPVLQFGLIYSRSHCSPMTTLLQVEDRTSRL